MIAKKHAIMSEDGWKITAKRYVAFIDIMGFKDMVARSTHDQIYRMMKKIDKAKKLNESVKWADVDDKYVRSTFYSDSIILYSKDDTFNSAHSINCTVSALTNDLLSSSIPHKGAFAFGKMTLDTVNSIFFGQPLIDAFLLQEELRLYCIVVHSSAQYEIERKKYEKKLILHNYVCPFKEGASNHLTIPPLYSGPVVKEDESEVRKLNTGIKNLRYRTSGHLRKYIDNTEAYIEDDKKDIP